MIPATLLALGAVAAAPAGAVVVLISADTEWKIVRELDPGAAVEPTPFGEQFTRTVDVAGRPQPVVFFHGGWGKIAAAASTQYAVDRWRPELLVNLGTCGGFRGAIAKGDVLLVEKTIVYDIVEQMGDGAEAIADYATTLDSAWAGADLPKGVRRGLLLSADRDILPADIPHLRERFAGVAADWESGAIAWVAHRNRTPVLVLRGVSDLVGAEGGEAYGDVAAFEAGARTVMRDLVGQLPFWLSRRPLAAGHEPPAPR